MKKYSKGIVAGALKPQSEVVAPTSKKINLKDLPATVDWRSKGIISDIKD